MSVESKGRFGSFILLEQISSSETSELYLAATDEEGKERRGVVLKRLKLHFAGDTAYREAFLGGAKETGRLEHPQICRVFESDTIAEQPYLAREYAPGKDLRNLLRRHAIQRRLIPQPVAISLVHRIAAALAQAHPGMIHGSLTPQDILVGFEGEIHLINFGMGRYWAALAALQGVVPKEKSAYLSPEHFSQGEIDHRADIFSLGALLYEMLTGKQLFDQGLDRDRVEALSAKPLPAPSEARPSLDGELDRIVMRALELDPMVRYQDVAELTADLRAVGAGDGEMSEAVADLGALMMRTFPNEYRLEKEREALLQASSASGAGRREVPEPAPEVEPPTAPPEADLPAKRRGGAGIWLGLGLVVALVALGGLFTLQGPSDPGEVRDSPPAAAAVKHSSPSALAAASPGEAASSRRAAGETAARGTASVAAVPAPRQDDVPSGVETSKGTAAAGAPTNVATKESTAVSKRASRHDDPKRRTGRSSRGKGNRKQRSRTEKPQVKVAVRAQTPEPPEVHAGTGRVPEPSAPSATRREERDPHEQPVSKGKGSRVPTAALIKQAPPPQQATWGFFKIISPVLVDVEVDGWRSAVSTGSLKLKLRVGQHKIRVIFRESGKEFTKNVTIKPNKTTKLKLVNG